MKSVIRIIGRIAYGLLVVYLCLMLAGGLIGTIIWSFADVSKLGQFVFNFAVGLIGLIGLFYRKDKDDMLDKSS